jgi:hypothetical protein
MAMTARPSTGREGAGDGATAQTTSRSAGNVVPIRSRWQERTEFVIDVAGGTRRAAELLGVAASQPSRWASGKSVPAVEQARLIVDLDHVFSHVLLVWAKDVAMDWLHHPNVRLDGARPIDWIRYRGSAEVIAVLQEEAAGAFA